jgi:hypothetical protein
MTSERDDIRAEVSGSQNVAIGKHIDLSIDASQQEWRRQVREEFERNKVAEKFQNERVYGNSKQIEIIKMVFASAALLVIFAMASLAFIGSSARAKLESRLDAQMQELHSLERAVDLMRYRQSVQPRSVPLVLTPTPMGYLR